MTPTHHRLSVAVAQSRNSCAPRHNGWHLTAAIALACTLAWGQASAQTTDAGSHGNHGAQHASTATPKADASTSQELSEGEITRWDARSQKITLRHGELKNLNMPPMTMVFTLQDPTHASQIKVGDKVRFRAEQVNGAFVVTHLEP